MRDGLLGLAVVGALSGLLWLWAHVLHVRSAGEAVAWSVGVAVASVVTAGVAAWRAR